jgi:DNA polymerase elongation subunit (family B)
MGRGRPPLGARHVDRLDGSDAAKERLKTVIETLTGERTVEDACRKLELGRAAFARLRERILKGALGSIEPRRPGRPKKARPPEPSQVEDLQAEVRDLSRELRASQIREQLARTMPHLLKEGVPGPGGSKKKATRAEKRRRTKEERKRGRGGRGDMG